MSDEKYEDHVHDLERNIGSFGFKSVHGHRLDQTDAVAGLSDEWKTGAGRARLLGRTPVSLDRDRILYSDDLRRQDDKFHVLFFGSTRLARTYTSHTLKTAHVARVIAPRIGLNAELTEAMVLGSKVGGVPFLHVGKKVVSSWVQEKIENLDADRTVNPNESNSALFSIDSQTGDALFPSWLDKIQSRDLKVRVSQLLPWAVDSTAAAAYASGQQSYWSLTLNPYTLGAKTNAYMAQTMYGVWRHSLVSQTALTSEFHHKLQVSGVERSISDSDATHEAVLGRYCDDITWVLENLNEASRVAALDGASTAHQALGNLYGRDFDAEVLSALGISDTGALYTYFIDDLVKTTKATMQKDGDASSTARETEQLVGLSNQGERTLEKMKDYLSNNVFSHERVEFRNETLKGITRTALNILYKSFEDELPRRIERNARLTGWASAEMLKLARDSLKEPVHRVQVAVDVLSAMSDREVFELVGLE